jgi:hypothetical protein
LNYKKNNTKNIKLTLNEILKLNLIEYKNSNLSSASWTFEDSSVSLIKEKIVSQGIPLSKWDIKIYRGILTGLNEAFVINNEIKDQLILEDPNCEKIIKPLLRGRDIEKYKINYSNLWLISTFPSLNINIDKYPSIKKHLASFGKKIEQSGEKGSRKKTSGQWFEIQDSIAYWSEFDKPKIIYPNMTKYMPFYYDDKGFYTNQKCFILTGKHIEYLTCFLNSNVFKFCFKDNFPLLLGGTRELSKVFFEKISIKPISDDLNNQFKSLLNLVHSYLKLRVFLRLWTGSSSLSELELIL